MKKAIVYSLVVIVALNSLTGCDFLRTVAGRPNSSDLDFLRSHMNMELQEKAAAEKAAQEAAQAALEAAADSIAQASEETVAQEVQEVPAQPAVKTPEYFVVVGSFDAQENADKFVKTLQEKGYDARQMRLRGMATVVIAGPENVDANTYCEQIRSNSMFPKDSWPYYPKN